jgi:hypothetical protein
VHCACVSLPLSKIESFRLRAGADDGAVPAAQDEQERAAVAGTRPADHLLLQRGARQRQVHPVDGARVPRPLPPPARADARVGARSAADRAPRPLRLQVLQHHRTHLLAHGQGETNKRHATID